MSIKKWLKRLPIPLTKNHKYDLQAKKVLQKVLANNSNCLDIGCHEGEFIDLFLKYAPKGQHIGFEPLPDFYTDLTKKYPSNCSFHNLALSDSKGESSFNYVISNPAYSGLQKRNYDKAGEKDTQITVQKEQLDAILPKDYRPNFIKIDVEGGEYQVLKGAIQTIKQYQPVIIFEHGLGAADVYGTTPEMMYELLVEQCGMQISLMENWLIDKASFSKEAFCQQFYENLNYYYIAYA